jgi:hypothetical protein
MKLIELLNKYDFSDILNEIITMFPDFEEKKDLFQQAYDVLMQLKPVESKKKIHYTLMTDPDTDEDFFGADDSCFNTTWEVCLCKEIVLDEGVELSEIEDYSQLSYKYCLHRSLPQRVLKTSKRN